MHYCIFEFRKKIGGVRGDVRPRPPREPVASNSLRPHLLLNAAHPRERGQVTVNLSSFSVPDQQGAFINSSHFPFSSPVVLILRGQR